jgi:hypothetical protein
MNIYYTKSISIDTLKYIFSMSLLDIANVYIFVYKLERCLLLIKLRRLIF